MAMRAAPPQWNMDEDVADFPDVGPTFIMGGEVFHCMPVPPLGALPRITKAAVVNDRGQQRYNALDLIGFVEDVLCVELPVARPTNGDTPEGEGTDVITMEPCDDVQRWQALGEDKSRPVPMEQLSKLVSNLMGYYSERPTAPSSR